MAEYRGPECPKCKVKSHQIEFARVAYWYCKGCREEVFDAGGKKPTHSMEPCSECGGTAAHGYWCSISIEHRKKKKR